MLSDALLALAYQMGPSTHCQSFPRLCLEVGDGLTLSRGAVLGSDWRWRQRQVSVKSHQFSQTP